MAAQPDDFADLINFRARTLRAIYPWNEATYDLRVVHRPSCPSLRHTDPRDLVIDEVPLTLSGIAELTAESAWYTRCRDCLSDWTVMRFAEVAERALDRDLQKKRFIEAREELRKSLEDWQAKS